MSAQDHPIFAVQTGGFWTTTKEQIEQLDKAHIPELQAIASDRDLGVTVRRAAERTIRQIQKYAAQGAVFGVVGRDRRSRRPDLPERIQASKPAYARINNQPSTK